MSCGRGSQQTASLSFAPYMSFAGMVLFRILFEYLVFQLTCEVKAAWQIREEKKKRT
jgi:hypothetical protein